MISHRIEVGVPAATAFRAFTEHVGAWWPPEHLPHGSALLDVAFETHTGGRLTLDTPEGTFVLGRITEWDPPRRLVYDFYVGSSATEPSSVEVRFSPTDQGTTVEIEHRRGSVPEDRWQRSAPGYRRAWTELRSAYFHFVQEHT